MKKNIQTFMLIALVTTVTQTYTRTTNQIDEEGVTEYVDSIEKQEETLGLLKELERSNPDVIERIILNEKDLEATFDSIRSFINKKNKEIEKLLKQTTVDEMEIARLTIELADASAALNKAIARYETKHKKSPQLKQTLQNALTKTEESLIALTKKAQINFKQVSKYTKAQLNKSIAPKNHTSSKKNKVMIADVEFEA